MVLVSSLWLALSFGSQVSAFYNYLTWWIGGTAIASMALAGFVTGAPNRCRGLIRGLGTGATTWALLVLGAQVFGLPGPLSARTAHRLVRASGSVTSTTPGFS